MYLVEVVCSGGVFLAGTNPLRRIDAAAPFLTLVCAEMRGCATHHACLILLLLSNDSSMN